MGQDRREQIDLIAHQDPHRHVVHLALALEVGKDTLLGAPAFVEGDDLADPGALVGHDHLEVVAGLLGNENYATMKNCEEENISCCRNNTQLSKREEKLVRE